MKAYNNTKGYRLTILSILLVFLISGCSLTHRLKPGQALVRKVTIKGVDKEFAEAAANYVDKDQRRNNGFNLQLYYKFSGNGKRDVGEPPNILDTPLVEFSRTQIQKFLQSKGYLKATVSDTIKVKNKKAELTFVAVEGPMFRFRSFTDSIADSKIRGLYNLYKSQMLHIRAGQRYDSDSVSVQRDEVYTMTKRHGFFDFLRQYITFDADTTFGHSVADVKMIVANPAGKSGHDVYTMNNTLITITNSAGRTPGHVDTVKVDSQFKFVDYSKRFYPRIITIYDFQRKGDQYNIDKQTLTTSRLAELNVFRNVPNPTYIKLPDSTHRLDTRIDMIPLKQMSDRVEGEFLFNGGRYGFDVGNTFTDRNIFKTATTFQLKLEYNTLFDNGRNSTVAGAVENQEFKIGASVSYPQILTPFDLPILGKYGVPHTIFSSNFSVFFQKGLVERQSFDNALTYQFIETSDKTHTVTPINIEFSRGIIDTGAQRRLTALGYYSYIYLIGRTIFNSGSQYTYQLNANKLSSYRDFVYFRGSLDVGGNTLSLLSNIFDTPRDALGYRTFFGQTFSQYAKGEIDLRFYANLGNEKQFILRFNPGLAAPYGNANLMFEKYFYAGGANDMRAWIPRTLGPGQFNRAQYGVGGLADTLRSQDKYLDQYGEVKFVMNAEYRYRITNNFFGSPLRGAFFMDAGNIWRLHKQQSQFPNQEIRLDNIWPSTAIGIGTGLRFDLSFFVFRLDAAFKFKDPQFTGSDQWVLLNHFNELFHAGPFKQGYLNTNGESYNFMQLNFGVGMPF